MLIISLIMAGLLLLWYFCAPCLPDDAPPPAKPSEPDKFLPAEEIPQDTPSHYLNRYGLDWPPAYYWLDAAQLKGYNRIHIRTGSKKDHWESHFYLPGKNRPDQCFELTLWHGGGKALHVHFIFRPGGGFHALRLDEEALDYAA